MERRISPENAPHNLEFSEDENRQCELKPPERDLREADFAAEAHGFTGFEQAGRGSSYRASAAERPGLLKRLLLALR